jgi:hypothetical protein
MARHSFQQGHLFFGMKGDILTLVLHFFLSDIISEWINRNEFVILRAMPFSIRMAAIIIMNS